MSTASTVYMCPENPEHKSVFLAGVGDHALICPFCNAEGHTVYMTETTESVEIPEEEA